MKIRMGFVSNSSSASFLVLFKSKLDEATIQQHVKDTGVRGGVEAAVITGKDIIYSYEASTSMFNDWYDIMAWPFIRMLDEGADDRYTLVSLTQVEKEYSDCNDPVHFNVKTWQTEDVEFDDERGENVPQAARIIAEQNQAAYEKWYANYLKHLKDSSFILSELELSGDYFEDKYGGKPI